MISIINKKRKGEELSRDELSKAFGGYIDGNIPDYQMSALLMAICINGMTEEETFDLVDLFIQSGDTLDLSSIEGIKVDKHSTGGIGDKTTLIIGPIVASLGVPVMKMSGRGLGYTGGTIDKLESIPGFKTNLTEEECFEQVKNIDIAVTGQTANLAPMDKKIYALRDVTGTVESIPLIVSSIMSKKIASGADKILIDVKFGKGAFMKDLEDAKEMARLIKKVGDHYHKEVRTIISDMNTPLGNAIGNSVEVVEAIRVLKNEQHDQLSELCLELASNMVSMGKDIPLEQAEVEVNEAIESGVAYKKFLEWVKAQGGDLSKLQISKNKIDVIATKEGTITAIDALKMGELSVRLGAGRRTKDEAINHEVGIVLKKRLKDKVNIDDVLCSLYVTDKEITEDELKEIEEYFTITE